MRKQVLRGEDGSALKITAKEERFLKSTMGFAILNSCADLTPEQHLLVHTFIQGLQLNKEDSRRPPFFDTLELEG